MIWQLPEWAEFDGKRYDLHTDFRDILEIMEYLGGELPEFIRWQVAVALFYRQPVEEAHMEQAMAYLAWFLRGGEPEGTPGPKLMDWHQDAGAIVSDINRVAGTEIRAMAHLHWWTFLGWFHAISEGQLSMLVSLRDKLRRREKLTPQEREFYRQNRHRVDFQKKYSAEELAEQERLKKLLGE